GQSRRGRRDTPHHRDEHPGADGPIALVRLALDGDHRPGDGVDPRRPRGHHRRCHRRPAHRGGQRPGAERHRGGLRRFRLHPRRLSGCPVLRGRAQPV
ncbi:MAG: Uncharacterized MFS-type transporter Saci_1521, partial [uncultured Corynebacteriales bacterium]